MQLALGVITACLGLDCVWPVGAYTYPCLKFIIRMGHPDNLQRNFKTPVIRLAALMGRYAFDQIYGVYRNPKRTDQVFHSSLGTMGQMVGRGRKTTSEGIKSE